MSIFAQGTLNHSRVLREGLVIVRSLLRNNVFGPGLSTAEVYKLASEIPAPEGFEGDPRLVDGPGGIKGIAIPPNNSHPIRSKVFLKKSILPALERSGEIKKVVLRKEVTAPVHKVKKGKVSKKAEPGTSSASPENPAEVPVWVWRPLTEEEKFHYEEHKHKSISRNAQEEDIDISYLNKRRQRSRE